MKIDAPRNKKSGKTTDKPNNEQARNQILDCAIKEFSKKGFGGASLRDIADNAGVSHSMIKYYFGGKEELWREAVNFLFSRQAEEMAPALASASSSDSLAAMQAVIEQMIRYSAKHPEHARLIMQASMTPGPHLDWVIKHLREASGFSYKNPTDKESEPAKIARESAIATHYLVYGACNTLFMLEHEAHALYDIDVADSGFIDRFVGIATQLLAPNATTQTDAVAGDYAKQLSAAIQNPSGIQTREIDEGLEVRFVIPKKLLPQ